MTKGKKTTEITNNWVIAFGAAAIRVDASSIEGVTMSLEGIAVMNADKIDSIAKDLQEIANEIRKDPDFNK